MVAIINACVAVQCTLVLVLFLSSCIFHGDEVEEYLMKAEEYYNNKDYQRALIVLNKAQAVNPFCHQIYEMRAWTLYMMSAGSDTNIIKQLEKAISLNSSNTPMSYFLRGLMLMGRDNKQAIEDFSFVIDSDPANPKWSKAYTLRAACYVLQSNYYESIRDASLALDLNPNEAKTYAILALAQYNVSNETEAERNLQKALQLAPTDGTILSIQTEIRKSGAIKREEGGGD